MSVSRARAAGSFSITPGQFAILVRAAQGTRLRIDGADEEAACLALWRAGLLRVNGETGFQLSALGLAAVRRGTAAARSDAAAVSGERQADRFRPAGEPQQQAARF